MIAGSAVDAALMQVRVSSLVRRALNYLDGDRAEACRCLQDAQMLLDEDSKQQALGDPALLAAREVGGLAAWQVRRAMTYIEDHLGSKFRAGDIATEIGLSKGPFSRAFKNSVGSSPMAYVAMRRVERAKLMMNSSAERLAEVALACGFSDQSHLTRPFQRLVGSAPGQWRRSLQTWV